MDADELRELMGEPPGGANHGRVRTSGGWRSLEPAHTELEYVIPDPDYRAKDKYDSRAPHGTRSRYIHGECRCEHCRSAEREYRRALRSRGRASASDTLQEP